MINEYKWKDKLTGSIIDFILSSDLVWTKKDSIKLALRNKIEIILGSIDVELNQLTALTVRNRTDNILHFIQEINFIYRINVDATRVQHFR